MHGQQNIKKKKVRWRVPWNNGYKEQWLLNITPCSLVDIHWPFILEAAYYSATSVNFHQNTRHQTPEESILHYQYLQKFKSPKVGMICRQMRDQNIEEHRTQMIAVIPRLTSDPANEFFSSRRSFSLFFGLG